MAVFISIEKRHLQILIESGHRCLSTLFRVNKTFGTHNTHEHKVT